MLSIASASSIALASSMRAPIVQMQMAKDMPGVTAPFGYFDPLGFAKDLSPSDLMLRRESELAHGRVAMVGALGFLVQESFHPLFSEVDGPAISHLKQLTYSSNGQLAFSVMGMAIGFAELARARYGWVAPKDLVEGGSRLQEGYIPGDLGFDPLGMKPTNSADYLSMQAKELNNGRLAMIAVAGMVGQELATQHGLFGA
jgi:light-harvesting complex I chlorophyll a/b binding protein 4